MKCLRHLSIWLQDVSLGLQSNISLRITRYRRSEMNKISRVVLAHFLNWLVWLVEMKWVITLLKSQNYVFRVHWLTIFKGKNPWDVSRKSMVLNDFIKALHEDEKELASKYKDERGTDWNAYVLDKEKSGFCKFDEWYFMDYSHITTQMDSK